MEEMPYEKKLHSFLYNSGSQISNAATFNIVSYAVVTTTHNIIFAATS